MIKVLRERSRGWTVEIYNSLSALLASLIRPLASQDTLILVKITKQKELLELSGFLSDSLDFDLVLLVENEDKALAQAALEARPRMLLNDQTDPEALTMVLERIRPRMLRRAKLLSH
ncbi:hypothetical protein AAU61_19485 [Desulfocarbo indianensis]|nr:hypothetical protein AAU61_19485 [Desulfocarbo indianensis]